VVRPLGKDQFEVLFRYKPGKKVDAVTLAGTFNNWDVKALAMAGPDKDGFFSVKRTLTRGVYEYKFVVNGIEWFTDPNNLRTTGTLANSLLMLGNE
jgi:1,4-alpha-glucan branching enzyme